MNVGPRAPGHWSVPVSDSRGVQVGDGNVQHNLNLDPAAVLPPPESVAVAPGTHNLPLASGVFIGRELSDLDGLLGGGRGVIGQAVYGLGGVGKSEMAVQYARRHADRYPLMWWITAESPDRIAEGLAGLTGSLHPMPSLAQGEAWALRWLQVHRGWLLVLDNVEDPRHIESLLGRLAGHGDVLVTTRRDVGTAVWTRLGLAPLRLDVLGRSASVDLLCQLTGDADRDGAARLAADLGDLPLALEQGGRYLGQHPGMTFDGYRALLASRFERVGADPGEGGDAERTIARVWAVTMAAITKRSPLAGRILTVLAYLAPDDIPEDILSPLADDPLDLADALALLASYSMISRANGATSVHRLIQTVTRSATDTPDEDMSAPIDEAIGLLFKAVPADPLTNPAGWPHWAALLPHIDEVTARLPHDHQNTEYSYVLDREATYLQGQGQLWDSPRTVETSP